MHNRRHPNIETLPTLIMQLWLSKIYTPDSAIYSLRSKCTPLTQQYTLCGRNSRCVCHIWPHLAPLICLRTIYITVKNIDHWIVTLVADKLRRQWLCEVYDSNRGYIPCPVKDSSSTWIRLPMKFIAYLHQKGEVLWLYSCIILMNSDIDVPGQHSFVVTCDWEVVHYKKAIVISTSHLLSEFKMSEHRVWTENSVNRLFTWKIQKHITAIGILD